MKLYCLFAIFRGAMNVLIVALLSLLPLLNAQTRVDEAQLRITGPAVVFFGPSQADRDSIARGEGLEIDDILDDFNYTTGKVAVYLSSQRIPVHFTTDPRVLITLQGSRSRTFERRTIPDIVGMILTDGTAEPRVLPGIQTDRELIAEIDTFFHLQ